MKGTYLVTGPSNVRTDFNAFRKRLAHTHTHTHMYMYILDIRQETTRHFQVHGNHKNMILKMTL